MGSAFATALVVLAAAFGNGAAALAGPTPTPAAPAATAQHAPTPTRSGPSPTSPDPHPPEGGRAPDGSAVGGKALLTRSVVRVAGSATLPKKITATAFMVTDLDTGEVLAARDPHGRYQPASVLKLLTSLTIMPKLRGDQVVVASKRAANAEGSTVGLVPGGRYSIDTLFKSLFLMSGNDAAVALSEAAGGVDPTVAAMNSEARALGAYDTVVETPSGLDGWHQLTSAYDLTLVLRAAVRYPRLLAYDRTQTASLPAQHVGKRKWGSVPLFNQSQDFFENVPGALLAKTGYTDAAQHTYVCAASRKGRRIGVVLLRAQRAPLDQWQQAAALLKWAYRLPSSAKGVGSLSGSVPPVPPLPSPTSSATASGGAGDSASSDEQSSGAAEVTGRRPAQITRRAESVGNLTAVRVEIVVFSALGALLAALIGAGTVASRRRRH